jgi:hypothetical protein
MNKKDIQKAINDINNANKILAGYDPGKLTEMLKTANQLLDHHRSNLKIIQEAQNYLSYNNNFQDLLVNSFSAIKYVREYNDIVQLYEVNSYDKYNVFMFKMGWVPSLVVDFKELFTHIEDELMPTIQVQDLNTWTPDPAQIEKFDQLFIKLHAGDNILYMQEKIKSKPFIDSDDASIIDDIFEAHLNSRYNLAIPTLVSRLEAFVIKAFDHVGIIKGKHTKDYWKKIFHLNDDFDLKINDFINEVFYETFTPGNKAPSGLNRHVLAHGGSSNYGNIKNSLNAILLYFNVVERSQFYEDNLNVLHSFCCTVGSRKEALKYHMDDSVSGCTKCPDCF